MCCDQKQFFFVKTHSYAKWFAMPYPLIKQDCLRSSTSQWCIIQKYKKKYMIFCSIWYHSTVYDYDIFFSVNLVQDQGLRGKADMGAPPQQSTWTAGKAIDGNTNQSYSSNSCAITDVEKYYNTSIWWKVWLQKKFNVAYIEIYFRSDSKYLRFFLKLLNWR